MNYGQLPVALGVHSVECDEMMFYQYLPIKMPGKYIAQYEERLYCFDEIIANIQGDFIVEFGKERYRQSYVYLTAKTRFVSPGCQLNRPGYHSDGFMTNDINYIWSDCIPTIFNDSVFNLTLDDTISMKEMEEQALSVNERRYPNGSLLRLNQYCIHKAQDVTVPQMRTFLKISFSTDKYDLKGNAHNYLIPYSWRMKERKAERNIPQSKIN